MTPDEPQEEPENPEQHKLELVVREDLAGGVWANFVASNQSPHEITLDFCRADPLVPGRMILVARVSFSPVLLAQLHDLLGRAWQTWSTQQFADMPETPASDMGPGPGEVDDEQGTEGGDDPAPGQE